MDTFPKKSETDNVIFLNSFRCIVEFHNNAHYFKFSIWKSTFQNRNLSIV